MICWAFLTEARPPVSSPDGVSGLLLQVLDKFISAQGSSDGGDYFLGSR